MLLYVHIHRAIGVQRPQIPAILVQEFPARAHTESHEAGPERADPLGGPSRRREVGGSLQSSTLQ